MRDTRIQKKRSAGFTLMEMLLVVAAFAILAVVAVPFSNSSAVRGDLDASERTVESSLRRAYTYARSGDGGSDWGVHIMEGSATVFSGSSYALRDPDLDEARDLAPLVLGGTIPSAGIADVIFAQGTGIPAPTGTITLTADVVTKTLTINGVGGVTVD